MKQRFLSTTLLGTLLLLLFFLSGCPAQLKQPSSSKSWWNVYFTTPEQPNSKIPDTLVKLINEAQKSIHIAAFEFNLDPIAQALIAAKGRGVDVKWVTDDKHGIEADKKEGHGQFAQLQKAGIEVKSEKSGLMHNKFIIIDGKTVWTGSTNLTINGTQKNNNNVIVMRSPDVATIFEREFQEMWDGKFKKSSPSSRDKQITTVNGTPVRVLFGAEDNVTAELTNLITSAKSDIKFMAFSFTDDEMGLAMLSKANEGVRVKGIFELRGSQTKYSELPRLFCEGIPVRQDGNPRTFHHKAIVLDEKTLVTGSFNFSKNANQKNDENVVIIDNPKIAALYLEEFERRWAEGKQPNKTKIKCPG